MLAAAIYFGKMKHANAAAAGHGHGAWRRVRRGLPPRRHPNGGNCAPARHGRARTCCCPREAARDSPQLWQRAIGPVAWPLPPPPPLQVPALARSRTEEAAATHQDDRLQPLLERTGPQDKGQRRGGPAAAACASGRSAARPRQPLSETGAGQGRCGRRRRRLVDRSARRGSERRACSGAGRLGVTFMLSDGGRIDPTCQRWRQPGNPPPAGALAARRAPCMTGCPCRWLARRAGFAPSANGGPLLLLRA
jgi:hypothetical protein